MDTFREIGITTVEYSVGAIRLAQYTILLLLTPIIEVAVKKVLLAHDVTVNGDRPWDIQVVDKRFYARMLTYGNLGIGESFMEKWVSCKDPQGFGRRLIPVYKAWNSLLWDKFLTYLRWETFNLQTKERAYLSCNTHYNLGSEYFETFLDKSGTYSTAYWETNASSLEEAQIAKMELVAQKLKLKPGMRVLDLGCGFGSLCRYLAEKYQVQVVGVVNSNSMGEEAVRRCKGQCVEIQVADWRDVERTFDRVVCIEMVLHVGQYNLRDFFSKVNKWLKDDGLFLSQDISMSHGWPKYDDFVSKYFMPDVYFVSVEEILETSRGLLSFEGYQDMRKDLAKTGRSKLERFEQNWGKIKHLYSHQIYEATVHYFNTEIVTADANAVFAYQIVLRKNSILH